YGPSTTSLNKASETRRVQVPSPKWSPPIPITGRVHGRNQPEHEEKRHARREQDDPELTPLPERAPLAMLAAALRGGRGVRLSDHEGSFSATFRGPSQLSPIPPLTPRTPEYNLRCLGDCCTWGAWGSFHARAVSLPLSGIPPLHGNPYSDCHPTR